MPEQLCSTPHAPPSLAEPSLRRQLPPWALGVIGLTATFVAIGLGRFSFTPLMPMLVAEGVGSSVALTQAAAWMMLGYTVGAIMAAPLGRRLPAHRIVQTALLLMVFALGLAMISWPLAVHIALRMACGFLGALIIVQAPALLLRSVEASGRSRVAGLTYTGIGAGALVSGAVIPLAGTVALASLLMAALTVLAVIASLWLPAPVAASASGSHSPAPAAKSPAAVIAVTSAYAISGFAYLPHTTLWGNFVAQELGRGVATAGQHWMLFGLGAICGPVIVSRVAQAWGTRQTLALVMITKACMITLPFLTQAPLALALSITVVGAFSPGIVALVSARLAELGIESLPARWGLATTIFAIVQAAGSWIFATLYASLQSYLPLFPIAGASLVIAAALVAFVHGDQR